MEHGWNGRKRYQIFTPFLILLRSFIKAVGGVRTIVRHRITMMPWCIICMSGTETIYQLLSLLGMYEERILKEYLVWEKSVNNSINIYILDGTVATSPSWALWALLQWGVDVEERWKFKRWLPLIITLYPRSLNRIHGQSFQQCLYLSPYAPLNISPVFISKNLLPHMLLSNPS